MTHAYCLGLLHAIFLASLALLNGCGGNDPSSAVAAMNDSNLRKVANLYMAFLTRNNMQGPKDEAEFKTFIQNDMPKNKLDMMNVDPTAVDQLFTSEQDGQPFEIIYGLKGSPMSVIAVVFEQKGASSMRRVGFTNSPVKEVDDQQYELLKKNPETKIETTQPDMSRPTTAT